MISLFVITFVLADCSIRSIQHRSCGCEGFSASERTGLCMEA